MRASSRIYYLQLGASGDEPSHPCEGGHGVVTHHGGTQLGKEVRASTGSSRGAVREDLRLEKSNCAGANKASRCNYEGDEGRGIVGSCTQEAA
jgi:hypothetical protein